MRWRIRLICPQRCILLLADRSAVDPDRERGDGVILNWRRKVGGYILLTYMSSIC